MNEFRDSSPSGLVQRRHFPEEREEEVEKRREEEGDGEGIPDEFSPTQIYYIISCPIILWCII